jgi:iron complex outermembrane receptor protein
LGALVGPGAYGAATPNLDVTSLVVSGIKPGAGMGAITSNPATGFYQVPLEASWSAVTGEANVDWTPDPNTLVYFRYSHGYKSGGFNTLGPISANEETKSEFVDAYELGAKKTLGRTVTLNGALFYYNYPNDQVPLTVDQAGALETTIYNVPLVRDIGAELEGRWRPLPQLELGLNYAFLKATIANAGGCVEDTVDPQAQQPHADTSGCTQVPGSGVVVQNIHGQTLPQAPRNTISLDAVYTLDFAPGALSLSGSAIWKDVAYGSVFNRDYSKSPSYATLNLRALWGGANGRYNVIAYCNNVTNTLSRDSTIGVLQGGGTPGTPAIIASQVSLNPPRIFGLELQYRIR